MYGYTLVLGICFFWVIFAPLTLAMTEWLLGIGDKGDWR